MNEISKLAFIDELEKIGFEGFDKEAFLSALRMSRAVKGLGTAAKGGTKLSPAQMAARKAQWAAGAGKSGQMTRKITPPSQLSHAAMQPKTPGGVLRSMAQ